MLCYIKVTWSSNLKNYEGLLQQTEAHPSGPFRRKTVSNQGVK